MHALHARGVHEYLEPRPRQREQRDLGRIELERQEGSPACVLRQVLGRPRSLGAEVVRAQDCPHDRQEAAQNSILVEAGDRVDRHLDRAPESLGHLRVGFVGIEPGHEQLHQQPGDVGVADQRAFHVGIRERDPGLAQPVSDEQP